MGANLIIAASKFIAAFSTVSAAMLSQGIHSVVETGTVPSFCGLAEATWSRTGNFDPRSRLAGIFCQLFRAAKIPAHLPSYLRTTYRRASCSVSATSSFVRLYLFLSILLRIADLYRASLVSPD